MELWLIDSLLCIPLRNFSSQLVGRKIGGSDGRTDGEEREGGRKEERER